MLFSCLDVNGLREYFWIHQRCGNLPLTLGLRSVNSYFAKSLGILPKLIFWSPYVLSGRKFWNTAWGSQMGGSLSETLQPWKGIRIFSRITLKQRNGQEQTIWILEKFKTTELLSRLCASQVVLGCFLRQFSLLLLTIDFVKWNTTVLRVEASETTIIHIFYETFSTSIGMMVCQLVQEFWHW